MTIDDAEQKIWAQKQVFAVGCASRPPFNMSGFYYMIYQHLLESFIAMHR